MVIRPRSEYHSDLLMFALNYIEATLDGLRQLKTVAHPSWVGIWRMVDPLSSIQMSQFISVLERKADCGNWNSLLIRLRSECHSDLLMFALNYIEATVDGLRQLKTAAHPPGGQERDGLLHAHRPTEWIFRLPKSQRLGKSIHSPYCMETALNHAGKKILAGGVGSIRGDP